AGAFHALPYWKKVPKLAPLLMPATRSTLAVSVGEPLDAGRLAELPREQLLAELLEALRQVREQAERLRRKREPRRTTPSRVGGDPLNLGLSVIYTPRIPSPAPRRRPSA